MALFKVGDVVRTKTTKEMRLWQEQTSRGIPFGWNPDMSFFSGRPYIITKISDVAGPNPKYHLKELDGHRYLTPNQQTIDFFSWSEPMLDLFDENL